MGKLGVRREAQRKPCGTPWHGGLRVKMSCVQGQRSGSLAEDPECSGGPGNSFKPGSDVCSEEAGCHQRGKRQEAIVVIR